MDDMRTERLAAAHRPSWVAALLPGTQAPGEASGRIGLALVAVGADRPLLAPERVVLPARELRRHRRQLDLDPDRRARHVGAADRRLCRPLHRQHGGADRHHRRQGRRRHQNACSPSASASLLGFCSALINGIAGAQAEHLAADRHAGDARPLWRLRLRGQQHGGLRISRRRCSSWAAARSSASNTP